MSNSAWLRAFGVLALIGGLASPVRAQLSRLASTSEQEITIDAESVFYNRKNDTVYAIGDVVIRRGETELRADEIRLDRAANVAQAIGNVTLDDPEGLLYADLLRLSLDDETGKIFGARLFARRLRYTLWGTHLEKGLGQTYHIDDGHFTTCDCPEGPPTWTISGETMDVDLAGSGCMRGARLYIQDVPVLYLPRLWFPVNRERQSGLLLPRVGFTNRRGLQILQPLFWAINKSHDATISVDVETSARLGLTGEYRYALSRNVEGQVTAGYFNEAIRGQAGGSAKGESGDSTAPENRWGLFTEHSHRGGPVLGFADVQIAGDDLFLREINTFTFDYADDVALRTRPFTRSRLGAVGGEELYGFGAQAIYYQDLTGSDAYTIQRVPEAGVIVQAPFADAVLGYVGATATNFQRRDGIDGLRGDLRPGFDIRLPLGRSFHGVVGGRALATAYQLTQNEMTGGYRGTDPAAGSVLLPETSGRVTGAVHAEVGTGFERVFDFPHFGVARLKHTVEPELRYLYIPKVDQDDIMVFDGLDRIDRRNLFTYGFASRLLVRRAAESEHHEPNVFELVRLSIWQSVDVERTIPKATEKGERDHLSDVGLELLLHPSERTRFRFDSSVDPSSGDFTVATVGVRFLQGADPGPDADGRVQRLLNRGSLGVNYRFITDDPLKLASEGEEGGPLPPPAEGTALGIQQVDADLALPLTDRLGFLYATRYNFRDSLFLENFFGVRLLSECDCWGLLLGIADKSNPNELEFRVQLTVAGLDGSGFFD